MSAVTLAHIVECRPGLPVVIFLPAQSMTGKVGPELLSGGLFEILIAPGSERDHGLRNELCLGGFTGEIQTEWQRLGLKRADICIVPQWKTLMQNV